MIPASDTPQPDTGKQPEREYRITESELVEFHRAYIPMLGPLPSEEYARRQRVMQEIRSRTVTPVPDCKYCLVIECRDSLIMELKSRLKGGEL